jgi:hypothetical protein
MANWNRRKWLALAAAFVVLIAGLAVLHSYLAPEPGEPLPNPNGYDDFVAAGEMLADRMHVSGLFLEQQMSGLLTNKTAESLRSLRGFVSNNRTALDRAHLGLTRACRVRIDYSTKANRHDSELFFVGSVAGALAAEGNLAQMEGKPMEAAQDYVGGVKLGMDVAHGGLIIDALVGAASESWATGGLRTTVPQLDGAQSREILEKLRKLESTRETKQEILEHEDAYFRRTLGFVSVFYDLRSIVYTGHKTPRTWHYHSVLTLAKYDAQRRQTQEVELQLALRAFELEKGRKAQGWGDLVPDYLKEIPKDPGTEKVVPWPPVLR